MKDETWAALESRFAKHPVTRAESVPYEEIDQEFSPFGVRLPQDYREFIHRYGGASVGPFRIYGLRRAGIMGEREGTALQVTLEFRKQSWPGVEKWLVFSMDHSGNPVGFDNTGVIWISDHDAGGVEDMCPSFEDYLRRWCLKLDPVS